MDTFQKATVAVVLVGVVKTVAVQQIFLEGLRTPAHVSLAVFAAATLLTALVAVELYRLLSKRAPGPARARRNCPASDETCKEEVIRHYRHEWNLSAAEVDVAIFALKGFSNNEIAALRNTTVTTVKSQLGAVYHKSGLKSRYQLIAFVTDEMLDEGGTDTPPRTPKGAGDDRTRAGAPKPWTVAESLFVAGETANKPGVLSQQLRGRF